MKAKAITPEMLEAGAMVVRFARYRTDGTPMPKDFDAKAKARLLFAAPDSLGKKAFLRMARRIAKSDAAEKAAEEAGLYSPSGLYGVLCDLSEHICTGRARRPTRCPPSA